ncbi:DNA translocase FtsK [Kingella oralis]|uniref:DNA translocase FtsK n=1 Tax=Kingella oralis TaxID=505 RepID=UPI0034E42325
MIARIFKSQKSPAPQAKKAAKKSTSSRAPQPKKTTAKPLNPKAKSKAADAPRKQPKTVLSVQHGSSSTERDRNLTNDTLWLFGLVATCYSAIALLTFTMRDPSWSRSVPHLGMVKNLAGLLGAYLADIAYYLFGFSAWWCIIAAGVALYRTFRPLVDAGMPPYKKINAGIGLGMMMIASPVLEAFAFNAHLDKSLPFGAGGLVGSLTAAGMNHMLGRVGGAFVLVILVLLSLSFIVQISWLDFMEKLGVQLERFFRAVFSQKDRLTQPEIIAETKLQPRVLAEVENIIAVPVAEKVSSTSNRKNKKMAVTIANPAQQSNRRAAAEYAIRQPENGIYRLPELGSLKIPENQNVILASEEQLRQTGNRIEAKLAEFGIDVDVVSATAGPVITRYEIIPAKGVKGSQIVNLAKDLARSLAVQSVRVVETIAGKNTMGIELPNAHRQEVLLHEIFTADVFADAQSKLSVALGKDIAGDVVVGDLAKMPHLLVGGMTGSGKSVGVNAMIMSMLFKATPDEVRFIMIDPKMLELSIYDGIPHLLCPVVTDMREAGNALNWCVAEMEKRYRLLSYAGVRNLASYNEKIQAAQAAEKPLFNPFSLNPDEPEPLQTLPQIVVVIDELADLMMTEKKAVETQIARLAQKARAAGIHMIIATQRPSVDVITGLIKANVPTRMAFTVQSRIDSRTILDQMGAEDLLKYGDLLFLQPGNAEPTRLQGAFVSDDEVHRVVDFIKQQAEPNYVDGILTGEATEETNQFIHPESRSNHGDDLFDQAVQFVVSTRKTSISSLQRQLRIGYNRAANLMQALEDEGIVSPAGVDGKRSILSRTE